ncbi:MAG: DUF3644 domain-containing protein [Myxococcales bacterium]
MAIRPRISPSVIRAYKFLTDHEARSATFTISELAAASGWKESSAKTIVAKKLRPFVAGAASDLAVKGVGTYTEAEFVRLMSQRQEVAADPKNPRLPPEIEALVRKARESALLGLQIYNNPTTVFKTEGFVVLMVIAWTALLHAVLKRKGVDCHHTDATGGPVLIDGDPKMWELRECLREFFKNHQDPVRTNLEFFIGLRNRVEHRYVPAIDPHVAGECQAMLLNFDDLLAAEFGPYFGIRDSLTVPLQTSTIRSDEQGKALRKLQAGHFEEVKEFVDRFRAGLEATVGDDQRFSFRVFLVPKVGNHRSSSDLAVEFVKVDSAQAIELGKQIVAVKERQVAVHNLNLFKPSVVAREVAKRIGKKFTVNDHTMAWKKYRVRPNGFATSGCDSKFCVPDPVHQDFVYTQAWIDQLVQKLSDPVEYEAVQNFRG